MTSPRPKLILLDSDPSESHQLAALSSAFDVVRVENLSAIADLLTDRSDASVLLPADLARRALTGRPASDAASLVLEHLGEGVGVVDADGTIVWSNAMLADLPDDVRTVFAERCHLAMQIDPTGFAVAAIADGQSHRYELEIGESTYELLVSPAEVHDGIVVSAVGALLDISARRRLQAKIDAIDAAGSELMRIEATAIRSLNMAERLQLLEEKIVHFVNDLLNFDNFEIRLLDRETARLELVIAVGLTPLKIGEVIYAEAEGNGISGFVAATGTSYLCDDVRKDARYREGLDNAMSSLTVPLRLHDRIIGVFNIESFAVAAFDEYDRQFAEIFGRYIAMAMNILDLLVVERYTTNEQVAENVLEELGEPLARIAESAEALRASRVRSEVVKKQLKIIIDATETMRDRLRSATSGPNTILGAEQAMRQTDGPDPAMAGKRILIADDEPVIRDALHDLLVQRGCAVTVCADGISAIKAIDNLSNGAPAFDLVVSDIQMPDRNGYEIFRAVRALDSETPVILMTGFGYDPHHCIVRASQEGLHSLLFKPFKATQLLDIVRKAFSPGD